MMGDDGQYYGVGYHDQAVGYSARLQAIALVQLPTDTWSHCGKQTEDVNKLAFDHANRK
jgi:hypothetical protein